MVLVTQGATAGGESHCGVLGVGVGHANSVILLKGEEVQVSIHQLASFVGLWLLQGTLAPTNELWSGTLLLFDTQAHDLGGMRGTGLPTLLKTLECGPLPRLLP